MPTIEEQYGTDTPCELCRWNLLSITAFEDTVSDLDDQDGRGTVIVSGECSCTLRNRGEPRETGGGCPYWLKAHIDQFDVEDIINAHLAKGPAGKGSDAPSRPSDGFRPCPVCGRALDDLDIVYYDDKGETVELNHVQDLRHMYDPRNAMSKDTWEDGRELDKEPMLLAYELRLMHIERISLECLCGYSFSATGDSVGFPDDGWFDAFGEMADRRA